jgi:hypothetical protein
MAQQTEGGSEAVPALGIIMLNTRFPRVVGDIGNPSTFAFPVRYQIVDRPRDQLHRAHRHAVLPADVLHGGTAGDVPGTRHLAARDDARGA